MNREQKYLVESMHGIINETKIKNFISSHDSTLIRDELLACLTYIHEMLIEDTQRIGSHSLISHLKNECLNLLEELLVSPELGSESKYLEMRVRQLMRIAPSVVLSSEWMSPSTNHSFTSQRGRYCEHIEPGNFDYKRDRHKEAEDYENAYDLELKLLNPHLSVRSFVCSSGMSTINTLINFLSYSEVLRNSLMLPEWAYYETVNLCKLLEHKKLSLFNTADTSTIVENIFKIKPEVLFLEGIANSEKLVSCDIIEILNRLQSEYKEQICIILDTTTTPLLTLENLLHIKLSSHIRLISVESLAKYHQCGLDIATGGIATFINWGESSNSFIGFREKFGTNANDNSMLSLPRPSQMLLRRRYIQQCKNTFFVEQCLSTLICEESYTRIKKIYTSKPLKASSLHLERNCAGTSILNIHLEKENTPAELYQSITKIVDACKSLGVEIREGTSFGFNTSRITLVGPSSDTPFIRLSVGMETESELTSLCIAIVSACKR